MYDNLNWDKKAFDKTQHPFMIKSISKLGIEVGHLNLKREYTKAYILC